MARCKADGEADIASIPLRLSSLAFVSLVLGACSGAQSVHDPAGPEAEIIGRIGWIMYWGAAAIFVAVLAMTGWAIWGPERGRRLLATRGLVVWAGIAFPVVTLTALLVYGLAIAGGLARPPGSAPMRVEVVGERWWWRVHYLAEDGSVAFASANEVRIPAGQPVEFIMKSADVIHSFWVPKLAGKLDMIPGHVNSLFLEADVAGVFRGQCAEYCGLQHALMAFDVVAETPEDFQAWISRESGPALEPDDPFLDRGKLVFENSGCGACHTIRGTEFDGQLGPDLTHVGSRRAIGAGTLPNNVGTLAGWISDSQHLKTGNLMPNFDSLSGEDLRAVAAYLHSLK